MFFFPFIFMQLPISFLNCSRGRHTHRERDRERERESVCVRERWGGGREMEGERVEGGESSRERDKSSRE
jgi:hypothetical protein